MHSNGTSFNVAADYYDPEQIENLFKLVAKLIPNPDNRVPQEPGFCVDRAYFRDPLTASQGEQVILLARLPDHPSVEFTLILAAGLKPDTNGLLERAQASEGQLSLTEKEGIGKIRAVPRTINGLAGEELVRRGIGPDGTLVHSFWWEVNGTEDDVDHPHVVFKMVTGESANGPMRASMSETVAFELWDKISSSLRVRQATKQNRALMKPAIQPTGKEGV